MTKTVMSCEVTSPSAGFSLGKFSVKKTKDNYRVDSATGAKLGEFSNKEKAVNMASYYASQQLANLKYCQTRNHEAYSTELSSLRLHFGVTKMEDKGKFYASSQPLHLGVSMQPAFTRYSGHSMMQLSLGAIDSNVIFNSVDEAISGFSNVIQSLDWKVAYF